MNATQRAKKKKRAEQFENERARMASLSHSDARAIQHASKEVNSKIKAKAAKKSARHMASEARWQGGEKIIMASSANAQPASDYTRQLSPRDGAIYKASTGKTFMRVGTK